MSSLFLPRDSVPIRNDDGSLAKVYVADVDVDSGEILVSSNPTTTSIMARQVMFHKTYLLEVIEENVADIGPTCELLRLRLQLLTERAKAHIQRQSSYASAHAAYVVRRPAVTNRYVCSFLPCPGRVERQLRLRPEHPRSARL